MGRLADIDAEMHELPDFEKGIQAERKRILEILEGQLSCSCETPVSHAIVLIKGDR